MSDPIADMLTRIRNGFMAHKVSVSMPMSKSKKAIAAVLADEGYIRGFEVVNDDKGRPQLVIELKYFEGRPVIEELQRVSRPGRRVYSSAGDIPEVKGGLGVAIVSTSKGIMTGKAARREGAGGEVLCTVF
jgi:small subunit ribosomal protein S8